MVDATSQIPLWFQHADELVGFVTWLRAQPVERSIERKYRMIEWCKITGVPLTAELVRMVYEP